MVTQGVMQGSICRCCGRAIEGRKRQYCGAKCRDLAQSRRQRKKYWEKHPLNVCIICGWMWSGHKSRYCSTECKSIAGRKYVTCEECGKGFLAPNRPRKYCSRTCCKVARSRVARSRATHKCVWCGKVFGGDRRGDDMNLYCSRRCYFRHKAQIVAAGGGVTQRKRRTDNAGNDKLSPSQKRRDRIQASGRRERISRREIFERDNWRCGICGRKVNRKSVHPHPQSPTLDHIVALAVGGTHTRNNLQCACFKCNIDKHTNSGGQLRLFG